MKINEYICKVCEGSGRLPIASYYINKCDCCDGSGYVDWIDNIMGGRPSYRIVDSVIKKMAEDIKNKMDEQIMKELFKNE